jgi:hypothetical protein
LFFEGKRSKLKSYLAGRHPHPPDTPVAQPETQNPERLLGLGVLFLYGVLVYFGYPEAHEDDAERAVRAGLELIQAVGGLKSTTSLQTRVGIATGLVVVGDLIGSGAAQEQAVVGETPNLAARLQGIAEPNLSDRLKYHTTGEIPKSRFRIDPGSRPRRTTDPNFSPSK